MPTTITARSVAILPCKTLDPILLKATRDFQTRYLGLGISFGASTSKNVSAMCTEQSTDRPRLASRCTTITLLKVKFQTDIEASKNTQTSITENTTSVLMNKLPVMIKTMRNTAKRELAVEIVVS